MNCLIYAYVYSGVIEVAMHPSPKPPVDKDVTKFVFFLFLFFRRERGKTYVILLKDWILLA